MGLVLRRDTIAAGLLVTLIAGSAARAQVIFQDHFNGNALAPHWSVSHNPSYATHVVGGGRLTVDWIQSPLGPPWTSAYNAGFLASFPPHQGDFVATLRLGWEPGTHRTVSFGVLSGSPGISLWSITYSEDSGLVHGSASGPGQPTIPAPPPGIHDFEIARIGSDVHFSLNSQHFGSMPVTAHPVNRIWLDTVFSYPGHSFQPVYFESITMIPSPSAGAAMFAIGLWGLCLRRRR